MRKLVSVGPWKDWYMVLLGMVMEDILNVWAMGCTLRRCQAQANVRLADGSNRDLGGN